jgi:8-oxo-dGTP diphosphatase
MYGHLNRRDIRRECSAQDPTDGAANWREAAACRSEDPELFFPLSDEGAGMVQAQRAKAVCARCPVIARCASAAMAAGEAHGVWGGLDERERRRRSRAGFDAAGGDRPVLPAGVVRAAERDVHAAAFRLPGAAAWLDGADAPGPRGPLVAEVWVFDVVGRRILLVDHPWRGLVAPGGKAEAGESPRRAAVREVLEETGLSVVLLARPAMAFVRRFREGSAATTLGLSYAAVVDPGLRLRCEPGQPAAWFGLDEPWASFHPRDRDRMGRFLDSLLKSRS